VSGPGSGTGGGAPDFPADQPPSPTPPPPRTGLSNGLLAAIVVVIVIVLVLGIGFAGVIPGFHLGSGRTGSGKSPTQYNVVFGETGLETGATWSVTLAGGTSSSTGASITFSEPNGSYPYSVGSVTGYTSSISAGTVSVSGSSVSQSVAYTSTQPITFALTFSETGLASGTNWSVDVRTATHSSTASTITFAESNGSYAYSVDAVAGYTASPGSGTATVSGAAVNVGVTFTASSPEKYPVTFDETGLATGTTWTVTLAGTLASSSGPSVGFAVPNGTYSFSLGAVSGYTPNAATGSVTVSGAAVSVPITFTANSSLTYPVTFTETGLASGASWNVVFDGVSHMATGPNSVVFSGITDGGYYFETGAAGYSATPYSGSITVNGAPASESISFSPSAAAGPSYNVTFNETGLPNGTEWVLSCGISPSAVFLVSTQGVSVVFALPNGTYEWGLDTVSPTPNYYVATPSNGNITVAGLPVTQDVNFTEVVASTTNYTITFTEHGLPAGVTWWVTLNGSTASSSSPTLVFTEMNGTYGFDVSPPPDGYAVNPVTGEVTVDGAPVTLNLHFGTAYSVTFAWSGPSVTTCFWLVELNGSAQFGECGSSLSLSTLNGTYPFTVTVVEGNLYPTPADGIVTVAGASVNQTITFAALPYTITLTETGLPVGYYWAAVLYSSFSEVAEGENLSGTAIVLGVQNGSYAWLIQGFSEVLNASGYVGNPVSGSVLVDGHSVNVSVTFVAETNVYPVEFLEAEGIVPMDGGLPTGSVWSVTLNGTTQSTSGFFIVFYEPNGTYNYTVTPPSGYVTAPGSGTFTVDENSSAVFGLGDYVYFGPTGSPLVTGPSASGLVPDPGGAGQFGLPSLGSASASPPNHVDASVAARLRSAA